MVRAGEKHSCFVQPDIAVIARRREAIGLAKQTFEMTSANPKLDGDAFDRNRFFEVGVHQHRRIREIHSRSRTLQSGIASLKLGLNWHGPMHRYRWAHNVTWRKTEPQWPFLYSVRRWHLHMALDCLARCKTQVLAKSTCDELYAHGHAV